MQQPGTIYIYLDSDFQFFISQPFKMFTQRKKNLELWCPWESNLGTIFLHLSVFFLFTIHSTYYLFVWNTYGTPLRRNSDEWSCLHCLTSSWGLWASVLSRSLPLNIEITQVLGKCNKCSDQSPFGGLGQGWILELAKLKVKVKVSLPWEVTWRSTVSISPWYYNLTCNGRLLPFAWESRQSNNNNNQNKQNNPVVQDRTHNITLNLILWYTG